MKVSNYLIGIALLLSSTICAQTSMTASPYSMFGIGEIMGGQYGQNTAMGGVGIGMRGNLLPNNMNPAGLTGIDSCRLVAEVSAFTRYEQLQSGSTATTAFTGNLGSFSLSTRIMPKWYAAVGLTPYSAVGYYFESQHELEGEPGSYYTSAFEGSGGLSKVYLTQAFKLHKHFSVGVNLNYILGNITQVEKQSDLVLQNKMYAKSFYADLGLQYHRAVGKRTYLTLGATYGWEQKLPISSAITLDDGGLSIEDQARNTSQYLPQYWGFGASLQHKKMLYALDYTYNQYSSLSSGSTEMTYMDAHKLRTGVSYTPDLGESVSRLKSLSYKIGVEVGTPYMKVGNDSGLTWRATAGVVVPVMNGLINVSLFHEQMQYSSNSFSTQAIGATISYTLGEWMYRAKL